MKKKPFKAGIHTAAECLCQDWGVENFWEVFQNKESWVLETTVSLYRAGDLKLKLWQGDGVGKGAQVACGSGWALCADLIGHSYKRPSV